ncbi:cobyric acid synthase [Halosegnis longus]|uniref:cobyric acid synthase n=1 Tax=Halosegnis longus TaxID=2216012 RepID=UPI00129E1912|nr:cobyric acid synthase [Halosegnis longus]
MTRTLLVAGTASHVGKSTVAAGLCRLFADRYDVAPFKAQNMSNNARAVTAAVGTEPYGEIGVSQYVQARAAQTPPTTDHNPVLLKPRGDGESQLVVNGRPVANVASGAYYDDYWEAAREAAVAAHDRLARDHDLVVAEGAGSIAEPNLHHRDLANVETARFGDADILLVADIERGGVFAHVVGTLELMPDDLTSRVAGVVITKFRGSRDLLAPGIEDLEVRTGIPVLGVVPYDDPGLPEEDSVGIPDAANDSDPDAGVTVGVVRLPHISNATDVEPLAGAPGVSVRYLAPDAPLDCDTLVLPGSKNTVDDLQELHAAGFGDRLAEFDGPILGICGGYQMLGERLLGADVEGTGAATTIEGFGLLPVETTFSPEKRVTQTTVTVEGAGPLAGATGEATGYEIHAGDTRRLADVAAPLGPDSARVGDVLGTYLHGLFENEPVRAAFLDRVFAAAGVERPPDDAGGTNPYDAAARLVGEHVDTGPLEP